MAESFDPDKAARFVLEAHASRAEYRNLPPEIAPRNVAEAYAAQAALARLLEPSEGRIAGLKIATTTKVMQRLMGIDHPCGGLIFHRRIHRSPAEIRMADHMHVVMESELAVRIGRALPKQAGPHTAASVKPAVAAVMPAFELIEDRNADYKSTKALSMIVDNSWNAGVVLGAETPFNAGDSLAGVHGSVEIDGRRFGEGKTDDPLGALAWVANLAIEQGRTLESGMVVITGSIIPTFPVDPGNRVVFTLDGFGRAEMILK